MKQAEDPKLNLKKKIGREIKAADNSALFYRTFSWFVAFFLAGVGVLIGTGKTDTLFPSKKWTLGIGAFSAGLAALQKGIQADKKAEWHTTRKRALELIEIESKRPSTNPSSLTLINLQRLVCETKIDPIKVLETLAIVFAQENKSFLQEVIHSKGESDSPNIDSNDQGQPF